MQNYQSLIQSIKQAESFKYLDTINKQGIGLVDIKLWIKQAKKDLESLNIIFFNKNILRKAKIDRNLFYAIKNREEKVK